MSLHCGPWTTPGQRFPCHSGQIIQALDRASFRNRGIGGRTVSPVNETEPPTTGMLRDAIDSYERVYDDVARNWTAVETKAQGTVTIAGVFIAAAVALVRGNYRTLSDPSQAPRRSTGSQAKHSFHHDQRVHGNRQAKALPDQRLRQASRCTRGRVRQASRPSGRIQGISRENGSALATLSHERIARSGGSNLS
jgi:hypothetical protein